MRTLIFGAEGQLGRDLLDAFGRAGEAAGHGHRDADVADYARIFPLVEDFQPDLLINAAAWNDVDGAEDHLQEAFLANETGARNVAEVALYFQIPVMHFGTDFVFDGQRDTPYPPGAPTAPLNAYGRSKAAGETAVMRANPRHFVVRTAWLYGLGRDNFVEKVLRAAHRDRRLRVVSDQIGSPTYTHDLAEAALRLARTHAFGVYHAVNAGQCSRYEFAREILRLAGLDAAVEPCRTADLPAKAPRPRYAALCNDAIVAATGWTPRPWPEALAEYLRRREAARI